jgi:hypothetical protein
MSISLQSSVRTCQVDTGWASRLQSARFEDPNKTVIPNWNGMDNTGRFVCADSYVTKTAGSDPLDRVVVENVLRPNYYSYVTLDADGIAGTISPDDNRKGIYGDYRADYPYNEGMLRDSVIENIPNISGHFGQDFGGVRRVTCATTEPYDYLSARDAQDRRLYQSATQACRASGHRANAGF